MPGATPQQESSPHHSEEGEDDVELQQPGPRGRAGLPPRAAALVRRALPHPPLVPPPPVLALRSVAGGAVPVLSEGPDTVFDVPRWGGGPPGGPAREVRP